jgi:hypothetical protein
MTVAQRGTTGAPERPARAVRPVARSVQGEEAVMYRCPREDLDCAEEFATTGDLDFHCHLVHGYNRAWRFASAFGRRIEVGEDREPRWANMGPASRATAEIGTGGGASDVDVYPDEPAAIPASTAGADVATRRRDGSGAHAEHAPTGR